MTEVSMSVAHDSSGRCEVVGCRSRSASRVPVFGVPRYVCQVHLLTLWFFASQAVALGKDDQDAGTVLNFVPLVRDLGRPGGGSDPPELRRGEGPVVGERLSVGDAPAEAVPGDVAPNPQAQPAGPDLPASGDAGRGR